MRTRGRATSRLLVYFLAMRIRLDTKTYIIAETLLLAVIYFFFAKFGLSLAVVHPSATAVWPPTGIALAALLVFGYRLWPGILLGAFFANATNFGTLDTSLGVALGNTLEAVIGVYLINRFANGTHTFQNASGIFRFALLGGMVATAVSATFGATSLGLAGLLEWNNYGAVWFTWWLGDAVGALVVTPLIVLWMTQTDVRNGLARRWEITLAFLLLILFSLVTFTDIIFKDENYPIAFLLLPFMVWIAVTSSQRIAALAVVIVSAIAIYGNIHGHGPFTLPGLPNESLLLLQAFVGIFAFTACTLSAIVASQKRTERQLQETNTKKDEFLAMLAHELRNPLAPMLSGVNILELRDIQDPEVKEIIFGIKRQIQNITELLEDLLDISRINEGKINLKLKLIDMNDIIHRAVESTNASLTSRQHSLTLEIPDEPVRFFADPLRLEQIVVNLLNNAGKYTKPGGKIWLSLRVEHGYAVIRVRDTGIGIAPDMVSSIFNMFNQVDQITPYHQGGLGIGLNLVQTLVKLHNGTVAAVSEGLGKGSEFIVRLPMEKRSKVRPPV